jgi:hypothetical protein
MGTEIYTYEELNIDNQNEETAKAAKTLAAYLQRLNNPGVVLFSKLALVLDGKTKVTYVPKNNAKRAAFVITRDAGSAKSAAQQNAGISWTDDSPMAQVVGLVETAKSIRFTAAFNASLRGEFNLGYSFWKNALEGIENSRLQGCIGYKCLEFTDTDDTVVTYRFDRNANGFAEYSAAKQQVADISAWYCYNFGLTISFKDPKNFGDQSVCDALYSLGDNFSMRNGTVSGSLCGETFEILDTFCVSADVLGDMAVDIQQLADFAKQHDGELKLTAVFTPYTQNEFAAVKIAVQDGAVTTKYCRF